MVKLKRILHELIFASPVLALLALTLGSTLNKSNYVFQLRNNFPVNHYKRIVNNYELQNNIRNNIVSSDCRFQNTPFSSFLYKWHGFPSYEISTVKTRVDYKQQALRKVKFKYAVGSDIHPVAGIALKDINAQRSDGSTSVIPHKLNSDGSYELQFDTVDKYGKPTKISLHADHNDRVALYDSIKHLTNHQYYEQQIKKHEYKIFCHDNANISYLSAYVPLVQIKNEYYYRVAPDHYLPAKYVDSINGYSLVAQNIPCYSKTFNSYGCIANTVVGQFDDLNKKSSKLSFWSKEYLPSNNKKFLYISSVHLNPLDPSSPALSWYVSARLKVNGGFIPQTASCVNSSNIMPSVYLSNSHEPFALNGASLKQPTYFSTELDRKMSNPKNDYYELPYALGAVAFYGIRPTSKYFFDFKHLKNGQVDRVINNYSFHSFIKPKSYYYNLNNTDYHRFGLSITDSANHKYWACDNTPISTPSKWHDFLLNSGYYIPYQYEKSIYQMMRPIVFADLYHENKFYHNLITSMGTNVFIVDHDPSDFRDSTFIKAPASVTK